MGAMRLAGSRRARWGVQRGRPAGNGIKTCFFDWRPCHRLRRPRSNPVPQPTGSAPCCCCCCRTQAPASARGRRRTSGCTPASPPPLPATHRQIRHDLSQAPGCVLPERSAAAGRPSHRLRLLLLLQLLWRAVRRVVGWVAGPRLWLGGGAAPAGRRCEWLGRRGRRERSAALPLRRRLRRRRAELLLLRLVLRHLARRQLHRLLQLALQLVQMTRQLSQFGQLPRLVPLRRPPLLLLRLVSPPLQPRAAAAVRLGGAAGATPAPPATAVAPPAGGAAPPWPPLSPPLAETPWPPCRGACCAPAGCCCAACRAAASAAPRRPSAAALPAAGPAAAAAAAAAALGSPAPLAAGTAPEAAGQARAPASCSHAARQSAGAAATALARPKRHATWLWWVQASACGTPSWRGAAVGQVLYARIHSRQRVRAFANVRKLPCALHCDMY